MAMKFGIYARWVVASALTLCFAVQAASAQTPGVRDAVSRRQQAPSLQPQMSTSPTSGSYVRKPIPYKSTPLLPPRRAGTNHFETEKLDATSRAAGVGSSGVNFPGFVGVPFTTITDADPLPYAYSSVSGDFNNDGKMDVATIKTDGTIDVILNPGSFLGIASLGQIVTSSKGNPNNFYIAYVQVADMNGDGLPDLIGQDLLNTQIIIWLGKGDGTFDVPRDYPVSLSSGSGSSWANSFGNLIVVSDFNGDGVPDVATATLQDNRVGSSETTVIKELTLLNDGKGDLIAQTEEDFTFQDRYRTTYDNSAVTFDTSGMPTGFVFVVFDAGDTSPAGMGVDVIDMVSNGDGTFKTPVEPRTSLVPDLTNLTTLTSVVATNLVDKTSSATKDIVFMTGDGAVYDAYFASGNPTAVNVIAGLNIQLSPQPPPPFNAAPDPPALTSTPIINQLALNVADMNGDGLQDVLVYTEGGVLVYTNGGNRVFSAPPAQMTGTTPGIRAPQPEDYDGSGYNSFLDVDSSSGQVGYFQNLGAAALTQGRQFAAAPLVNGINITDNYAALGTNLQLITTADVYGDGIQDPIGTDLSNNYYFGAPSVVVGRRDASDLNPQETNYSYTSVLSESQLAAIQFDFLEPVSIKNAAGSTILLASSYSGLYASTAGTNGVFTTPIQLSSPVRCGLSYADAGDINGDGVPDIVLAYYVLDPSCGEPVSGYVTFLGNSDGSFQAGTFTAFGLNLTMPRLINFSGVAGNLDLALIDYTNDSPMTGVFVIPNMADGTGNFNLGAAQKLAQGYAVSDIVPGDFNSDGRQDLTLLTEGQYSASTAIVPNTSGVLLFANTGNYTFAQPQLAFTGHFPLWGTYADFNGDGNPDLALIEVYNPITEASVNPVIPMVQILPGEGAGIFGVPVVQFSNYLPNVPDDFYTGTVQVYVNAGKFSSSGGPDLLVAANVNNALPFGTMEFINKGVTSLTLTTPSGTSGQGTPVTLSAVLQQSVSAGVPATGGVIFSLNGSLLGEAALSNGIATLTVTMLPVGTDLVTATYPGDPNHNQSAATLSIMVAPVTPSFSLTAPISTLTLIRGSTGTVAALLSSNSTFSGAIALSCTGAPAETSCTLTPTSVTLGMSESAGFSIVVETTPPNNVYQAKTLPRRNPWAPALGGVGIAGLLFTVLPKRKVRQAAVLPMVAVCSLIMSAVFTGCSNSPSKPTYPGTTAGTYNLSVTAVSGVITQTQSVILTVKQ